jgi:hypothetical protein
MIADADPSISPAIAQKCHHLRLFSLFMFYAKLLL